jgi:hypothetical protein
VCPLMCGGTRGAITRGVISRCFGSVLSPLLVRAARGGRVVMRDNWNRYLGSFLQSFSLTFCIDSRACLGGVREWREGARRPRAELPGTV